MNIQLLAFTEKGFALAQRLAAALPGQAARCNAPQSLAGWTARQFATADALVFVGAAGIAVRAIAPHLESKATDPAVVVVDECAHFAVPVLSGHLGGANRLARRIAALTGAVPVLTTATDANGVFAVDEWAVRQGCAVVEPGRIKAVSAKLLAGGTAVLHSPWPVAGQPPAGVALGDAAGCDFALALRRSEAPGALRLAPRILVLGVGCRRGTPAGAVAAAFDALLEREGIFPQAVAKACTIDLKAGEPGLVAFCKARALALQAFPAAELAALPGRFTASEFVRDVTGVDNVCERSAVKGSGGALLVKKTVCNGVTLALAQAPFAPDWRWKDE